MIDYIVSCELSEFPAWGGGKAVLKNLIKHPEAYDYIEDYLDSYDYDEIDATFVNNFLWFDAVELLENAGLYNCENDTWTEDIENE